MSSSSLSETTASMEENSIASSNFIVGDPVEIMVNKSWLPGKLVFVSTRSLIAEYSYMGKTFQKLFRNLQNLSAKGTNLDWDNLPDTNKLVLSSPEPSITPNLKINTQENFYLRQQAEKQRVTNQELVRKNLKLREDFDKLCQEFGELKMQFDTSTLTERKEPPISFSSDSEGVCPHFLKGKCRFKDKCRNSHDITYCVYCQSKLPSNKVASSAHLGKCYKRMKNWQELDNASSSS